MESFNLGEDNIGSSIIVSEPIDSQWNNLETEILDEEWQSWGSKEYENRDDFMNEMDSGEIEVAVRDSWQLDEITKIAKLLKNPNDKGLNELKKSSNKSDDLEEAMDALQKEFDDL